MKNPPDSDRQIDSFLSDRKVPDAPEFKERTLARLHAEEKAVASERKVIRGQWGGLLTAAATVALVAGGVLFLASGGDPDQAGPGLSATEIEDPWADPLTVEMFALAEGLDPLAEALVDGDLTAALQFSHQL